MSEPLNLSGAESSSDTAEAMVANRFENARVYADEAWALLDTAMSGMATQLMANLDFTAGWGEDEASIPTPEFIDSGSLLDGKPTAPTDDMENINFTATYDKVDVPTLNITTAPVVGAVVPTNSFSYDAKNYTEALLESLKMRMANDLNGGSGFSAAVEQAIYNRATNRLQSAQQELFDTAELYSESRGHTLPNGVLAGGISEAAIEVSRQQATLSDEILIQAATLEQKNVEANRTAIVQLESILIQSFDVSEARCLDAKKATTSLAIDLYRATLEGDRILTEVWKVEVDAMISQHSGILEQAKITAEIYGIEVQSYTAEVNAAVAKYTGMIDAYKASADAYASGVNAVARVEELKIKQYEALSVVEIKRIELLMKKAEAEMDAAIALRGIELESIKSQAAIAAQVVASALNSVNAAASYGYSGNVSSSYNTDSSKRTAAGATTANIHTWNETGV